jgi:hypothetical protein
MCEMEKKDIFLLEEYKSAVALTYHIDSLRNKLTSFFISLAGLAITGLILILKKDINSPSISNINGLIALLMILISCIGHLFICVLAKIRRVQIEHFLIINNIRKYFLGQDLPLWNVVILSEKTLPKPSIFSGTYYWLLILQILNTTILFIGVFLIWNNIEELFSWYGFFIFILISGVSIFLQNYLYFKIAKNSVHDVYTEVNLPYTR